MSLKGCIFIGMLGIIWKSRDICLFYCPLQVEKKQNKKKALVLTPFTSQNNH